MSKLCAGRIYLEGDLAMQRVTVSMSDEQVNEIRKRLGHGASSEELNSAVEALLDDLIAAHGQWDGRQYRAPSASLQITVAERGSQHHDISLDHDQYLVDQ